MAGQMGNTWGRTGVRFFIHTHVDKHASTYVAGGASCSCVFLVSASRWLSKWMLSKPLRCVRNAAVSVVGELLAFSMTNWAVGKHINVCACMFNLMSNWKSFWYQCVNKYDCNMVCDWKWNGSGLFCIFTLVLHSHIQQLAVTKWREIIHFQWTLRLPVTLMTAAVGD